MQDLKKEVEMTAYTLKIFNEKGIDDYFTDSTSLNVLSQIPCLEKGDVLRILDLGCGIGNWSRRLAERGHDVVGIDLSQDVIEFAREATLKRNLRVEFLVGDIRDLNFSESERDKFDLIFLGGVFHHLDWDEIDNLLDEIRNLLKKGGSVTALEWNKYYIKTQINYKARNFLQRNYSVNERPISPRKLRDRFLKNGFTHVEISIPKCRCRPGIGYPPSDKLSVRVSQGIINKSTAVIDLFIGAGLSFFGLRDKVMYGWQFLINGKYDT